MHLESCACPPGQEHAAWKRLLAQMYRKAAGEDMPAISKTPLGKPYFAEGSWHFSVSHVKGRVFCVLSRKNVGLDAEKPGRKIPERLAKRMLSESEFAQYEAAPDKSEAFLHFWVLKEALGKLTGKGIVYPPNGTEFALSDERVRRMDGCIVAVMEEA